MKNNLIDAIWNATTHGDNVGTLVGLPVIISWDVPKDKILLVSRANGMPHRLLEVIEMGPAAYSTSELLNELWHRAKRAARVKMGMERI
jgi:hypothetical protein